MHTLYKRVEGLQSRRAIRSELHKQMNPGPKAPSMSNVSAGEAWKQKVHITHGMEEGNKSEVVAFVKVFDLYSFTL